MRILVLGGDGYLGWPTCLRLSKLDHEVLAVDSYIRRDLFKKTNSKLLYEVPLLSERVNIWKSISGKHINFFEGDLSDWNFVEKIIKDFKPEAVVHFAEQPSAPLSMLDVEHANFTLINNISVTMNVIHAVQLHAPGAHIIKLGTMGEYGTPNIDIEEGWITVEHKGRSDKFLYPRQASSLYHTTKIMDTDLLWFYVRTWGLKVTDLMQGPVYGIFTDEANSPDLLTTFAYDEIFGTVLNRFITQAVLGVPLTVYGAGGQTRGYLNIKDTLKCIEIALKNPPGNGEMNIFNQFTETFSVNELADKVKKAGDKIGLEVKINHLENPRKEKETHYYNPAHTALKSLGLKPHYLTENTITECMEFVRKHEDKIDVDLIFKGKKWFA